QVGVDVTRVNVVGVGATVLVAPEPVAAGPVGGDVGPAFGARAFEENERGSGLGHDQGIRSGVAGQRCRATHSPSTETPWKVQPRSLISLMRQLGRVVHTTISRLSRSERNRRGSWSGRVGQLR